MKFILKILLVFFVFVLLNFVIFFFKVFNYIPITVCALIVLELMSYPIIFKRESRRKVGFALLISALLKVVFGISLSAWFYMDGQDEVAILVLCFFFMLIYILPTIIASFVYLIIGRHKQNGGRCDEEL